MTDSIYIKPSRRGVSLATTLLWLDIIPSDVRDRYQVERICTALCRSGKTHANAVARQTGRDWPGDQRTIERAERALKSGARMLQTLIRTQVRLDWESATVTLYVVDPHLKPTGGERRYSLSH